MLNLTPLVTLVLALTTSAASAQYVAVTAGDAHSLALHSDGLGRQFRLAV